MVIIWNSQDFAMIDTQWKALSIGSLCWNSNGHHSDYCGWPSPTPTMVLILRGRMGSWLVTNSSYRCQALYWPWTPEFCDIRMQPPLDFRCFLLPTHPQQWTHRRLIGLCAYGHTMDGIIVLETESPDPGLPFTYVGT